MGKRKHAGMTDAALQSYLLDNADLVMRSLAMGSDRRRTNAVLAIHLAGWDVGQFYAAVGERVLGAPDGS